MATTGKASTTAPTTPPGNADDQPFFTPQRIRLLGVGGAALLVVALAVWFTITAGKRKESFASA
ncbi:MAG: hypothetical protein ACRELE_06410, partial [Gemmatimonadales bacterium]